MRIVRNRRLAPFVLDGSDAFRYTARLRPGGGTADASVSKTDIERCVGSNPTPGTTSFGEFPRDHLSCTIESILIESVASDALSSHAQNAPRRSETAIPKNAWPRARERAGRFRAGSGRSARKEKPASPTGKAGFENPKRKSRGVDRPQARPRRVRNRPFERERGSRRSIDRRASNAAAAIL